MIGFLLRLVVLKNFLPGPPPEPLYVETDHIDRLVVFEVVYKVARVDVNLVSVAHDHLRGDRVSQVVDFCNPESPALTQDGDVSVLSLEFDAELFFRNEECVHSGTLSVAGVYDSEAVRPHYPDPVLPANIQYPLLHVDVLAYLAESSRDEDDRTHIHPGAILDNWDDSLCGNRDDGEIDWVLDLPY